MRRYLESHPWINFEATDLNDLPPKTWMLLGEASARCEQLARAPLRPDVAERLYQIAMVKGAQATTAIEGNTLTEEQVAGILDGTFKAPPSRAYQEREVRNVLDALQEIADLVTEGGEFPVTKDLICDFNRRLLEGTEHEPDARPGAVRTHEVVVANYRGAPAQDCDYLLDRLAQWLESETFKSDDPEIGFALTVARAVYAHLYMAWLHPFGDGNGRTARLLEFKILACSPMAPVPAAHLLSNHYNLTRDQYYRELAKASRSRRTVDFVAYAAEGFVDGLRDQIDEVSELQFQVAWINYVHEVMNRFPTSPARDRQRTLVLAMPSDREVSKTEAPMLDPGLAAMYATTGPRTLSRDLNRLHDAGIVRRSGRGWRANHAIMASFLAPVADQSS